MELYDLKYFRASKYFQHNALRLKELLTIIKKYNPKKVLDVGCGLGALVKVLQNNNIETYGVDSAVVLRGVWNKETKNLSIADAKNLPFANQSFDLVFSSDFFEHIPEQDIDKVKSEMMRVGKIVLARVAYEDKLSRKQALYHVTNKPESWWEEKLQGVILV